MQIIDADSFAALPAGLDASPTQQQQREGEVRRSAPSQTHFKIKAWRILK